MFQKEKGIESALSILFEDAEIPAVSSQHHIIFSGSPLTWGHGCATTASLSLELACVFQNFP